MLDRLAHNAYSVEMRGESMRKQRGEKGEKRKVNNDRRSKRAVEKTGKERRWKSLAIPIFSQNNMLDEPDHFLENPTVRVACSDH
jgi:hypothetical protein